MILAIAVVCLFTFWFFTILELGVLMLKLEPMTNAWKGWAYFSIAAATAINAILIALFA